MERDRKLDIEEEPARKKQWGNLEREYIGMEGVQRGGDQNGGDAYCAYRQMKG
jgi:hypothetical protein